MSTPKRNAAYELPQAALVLKKLILECCINQVEIAEFVGVSRTSINLCVNRGYIPNTVPNFTGLVETFLGSPEIAARIQPWLCENNYSLKDIWKPSGEESLRSHNRNHPTQISNGWRKTLTLGDPEELIANMEVEMLTQESRKHFKLFRDPFPANGGIEKDTDIFMADDHRFIEAAMIDAAKHSGLIAIIGQVGSGKSTIRKRVFEQLRKDGGILTVFPHILDKDKITSSTLCDAIILDVSDQKPKSRHEQKARQVKELLQDRSRNGDRCCLVIEEAHKLTVPAFITLKQLWELEDGYNKLLSIIIIGQTELDNKLDERHHPEMREFIRRCQVARIHGLNGSTRDYLDLKFRRIGVKLNDVFADEALESLSRRLTVKNERGKSVSHAYPLTVNMYAVRAINVAAEMGETLVTAAVVESL